LSLYLGSVILIHHKLDEIQLSRLLSIDNNLFIKTNKN